MTPDGPGPGAPLSGGPLGSGGEFRAAAPRRGREAPSEPDSAPPAGRAARGFAAYLLLYGVLYGGWGVLSPFLPAVLAERGATAEQIGLLLGLGIGARLVSMPLAGTFRGKGHERIQVYYLSAKRSLKDQFIKNT